ncbi:hypothetical protein BDV98DRAFT_566261, partial [Pterulicium gracile]
MTVMFHTGLHSLARLSLVSFADIHSADTLISRLSFLCLPRLCRGFTRPCPFYASADTSSFHCASPFLRISALERPFFYSFCSLLIISC